MPFLSKRSKEFNWVAVAWHFSTPSKKKKKKTFLSDITAIIIVTVLFLIPNRGGRVKNLIDPTLTLRLEKMMFSVYSVKVRTLLINDKIHHCTVES